MVIMHNFIRAVSDYHLEEIAKYCHHLEQLDVLGSNVITVQGATK